MTIQLTRREHLIGIAALSVLPACSSPTEKFDAEVLVLGSGLSGLHAAHLLKDEGKDVLLLEGSNRIGGRLKTIAHNGHYTEAGGEQIGAGYARILDRAHALGVSLEKDDAPRPQTAYHYKGINYGPDAWKRFEAHPLQGKLKGSSPGGAFFGLASRDNSLKTAEDWRQPLYERFDVSAQDYLSTKGLSESGLAFIDQALNGNAISSYSMMNVYRSLYLFNQSRGMGPSLYVKGGTKMLTQAMGRQLDVKLNTKITSIEVTDRLVSVKTNNNKTYRAPYCICSLPFGVLKSIKIKAPMPDLQRQAINQLPYTQIFQIHFETPNAYWEKDGLPPDLWTDSPMERLFANRNTAGDLTGLCRMWINGTGAINLSGKSDAEISGLAQNWLDHIRPSIGKVNIYHIQRWTHENPLAGGAYMHWGPGQIRQWAGKMGKPVGRLHFCGEHLSHLHTGMEGAMESAENSALSLLEI